MGRYRDLLLHRYRRSFSIALHLYSCPFDQAKNFVNYLRIFHKILAPGGVWINLGYPLSHLRERNFTKLTRCLFVLLSLGPLLWHWENSGTEVSVELDLEQVKALVEEMGFEIRVRHLISTFSHE